MKKVWKEVKREFEIDDAGNEKPVRVVRELDYLLWNRDRASIEFWLRVVSALAIVLTIFGLYNNSRIQNEQNAFQIRQQKALYEIGVFTKVIMGMDILSYKNPADSIWISANNEMKHELLPVIQLLKNDQLGKKLTHFILLADALYEIRELQTVEIKYRNARRRIARILFPWTGDISTRYINDKIMNGDELSLIKSEYENIVALIPKMHAIQSKWIHDLSIVRYAIDSTNTDSLYYAYNDISTDVDQTTQSADSLAELLKDGLNGSAMTSSIFFKFPLEYGGYTSELRQRIEQAMVNSKFNIIELMNRQNPLLQ